MPASVFVEAEIARVRDAFATVSRELEGVATLLGDAVGLTVATDEVDASIEATLTRVRAESADLVASSDACVRAANRHLQDDAAGSGVRDES